MNERLMAKPSTPLTAHWQEQLDMRIDAQA
jgi:hypothetical protein